MVNRGVQQSKTILERGKEYPALTWRWGSRVIKPQGFAEDADQNLSSVHDAVGEILCDPTA